MVLVAGGAAEAIPLPVLAAVLVTVAINMGEVRAGGGAVAKWRP